VLAKDEDCSGNSRTIEQIWGKSDHGFDEIVFQQLGANFPLVAPPE
jgi:hypothetical protein